MKQRLFVSQMGLLLVSLVILSLSGTGYGICRRADGTDCATANDECTTLFNRTTGDPISQLGFPSEDNHRECHRTCFEDGICKTHFRNQREIELISHDPTQYTVRRMFSPRFSNNTYRRSSNCRFNLQCSPGHLLSYSVTDFNLQDEIDCPFSDTPVCVDWVNHFIGDIADNHKVCGSGEEGEIHADGANSMLVEFVANRDEIMLDGFQYYVICNDPAFDNNAVNLGLVSPNKRRRRQADQCTSPSRRRYGRQAYYNPRPSTTTQPNTIFLILEMSHFISLDFLRIIVNRGEFGVTSYRVLYLVVTNRFSSRKYQLWRTTRRVIRGYGYLRISGKTAYFYQTGANPVFRPTPEEKAVIFQLEDALTRFLGDSEYYDVADELDNDTAVPVPSPSSQPGSGVPGRPPDIPTERPTRPPGMPTRPTERPTRPPGMPTRPTETPTRPPGMPTRPTERPTRPPGMPTGPTERPTPPPRVPTRPQGPPGMPTRPPSTQPPAPPGVPGRRTGPPGVRYYRTLPPGIRGRRSGTSPPWFTSYPRPPPSAAQLALRYGNACNGILRAVACAYQYIVLQRNCN